MSSNQDPQPEIKVGDTVDYSIPGRGPEKWNVIKVWNTNTSDGFMACLSRPDASKKMGVDRCNAPVSELETEVPDGGAGSA